MSELVRFPQHVDVLYRMDPFKQAETMFNPVLEQRGIVNGSSRRIGCLFSFFINIPKTVIDTISAIFKQMAEVGNGLSEIFNGNFSSGFERLGKFVICPIGLALTPMRFVAEQVRLIAGAVFNPDIAIKKLD